MESKKNSRNARSSWKGFQLFIPHALAQSVSDSKLLTNDKRYLQANFNEQKPQVRGTDHYAGWKDTGHCKNISSYNNLDDILYEVTTY